MTIMYLDQRSMISKCFGMYIHVVLTYIEYMQKSYELKRLGYSVFQKHALSFIWNGERISAFTPAWLNN